ncbi:YchE family NAAT transporter [Hahella sp. SMD15-11]|uniref:UPF0056 membrane protein n=1 Tax=Thermohahella caldifontis TaxID=3142973 RepID=A0AB39UZT8_9GAMM
MLEFSEYIKILVGLIAIVNPFGAVPVFISLTARDTPAQRRDTIHQAALAVGVILLLAAMSGELLLTFFGITINSFRVGGGILVLLMAISMLHARNSPVKQTEEEVDESAGRESISVVPLAMPLLAGPGAISTVILAANRGHGAGHILLIALCIAALCAVIWTVLNMSPLIVRRLGSTGINICTRIMGLILAAIAVEIIANGLKGLFPVLAG